MELTAEGKMSKRHSEWLANLIILAVTIVVVCLALEIGLRIAFARTMDFSMEMWKYATELKRPVADPELSFVHVPNRSAFLMGAPVSINSHGQRDREYTEAKPPGTFRIVILGDSTTFGWGVQSEETVAKILEQRLNDHSAAGVTKVEVINAGVGNYNTVMEVAHYLTYERAFHPDLVILQYFINDAEPVPTEHSPILLGKSYLIAFAVSRFDAMLRLTGARPDWRKYYADLYEDGRPGLVAAQRALLKLAAITRGDHAKLLVTILPELREINERYPFVAEHRKITTVLATENVPTMELIEGLRGHGPESTLWVTPADDHPNGKANTLVVNQMLPWVLETLKATEGPRAPVE